MMRLIWLMSMSFRQSVTGGNDYGYDNRYEYGVKSFGGCKKSESSRHIKKTPAVSGPVKERATSKAQSLEHGNHAFR